MKDSSTNKKQKNQGINPDFFELIGSYCFVQNNVTVLYTLNIAGSLAADIFGTGTGAHNVGVAD